MRTDASQKGYSGVLVQVTLEGDLQIIALISRKFTIEATVWKTALQECFAIQYAVAKLSYLLKGKEFIIQTDHANLKFMESSEIP